MKHRLLKLCLTAAAIVALVFVFGSVTAFADDTSGTCGDNLTWIFEPDTGTLTISGTGAMNSFETSPYGVWYRICSQVTEIEIGDGLTHINDNAFCNFIMLNSVTIPGSVTSIGKNAFYDCMNLKSVYITDIEAWCAIDFSEPTSNPLLNSGELYLDRAPAENIVIPNGVTNIGRYAFFACANLTSIEIPGSIVDIGKDAFYNCKKLESVYITDIAAWFDIVFSTPKSNPLYYANDLYLNGDIVSDLVIPKHVTNIKYGVFNGCKSLTSVTIPGSVSNIGASAFSGCTGLTSVVMLDGVESIGASAFSGCSGMASVTVPKTLVSVDRMAFYNCTGLRAVHISDIAAWCNISFSAMDAWSNPLFHAGNLYLNGTLVQDLVIPDGVTRIGEFAFQDGTCLTSITIPKSLQSIEAEAFAGCTCLKSVYITDIAAWCEIEFGGYRANPLYYAGDMYLDGVLVKELVLPNSIIGIGSYAFSGCTSLTSVRMSNRITSISDMAFYQCTGLTTLTLPNRINRILSRAFLGCVALKEVTIPASARGIASDAFENCSDLVIYCSVGSYAEQFAKNNNIPYVYTINSSLVGDLNGNGRLDSNDYLLLRMMCLGKDGAPSDDDSIAKADVNGNGKLDSNDYVKLRMAILGLDVTSQSATSRSAVLVGAACGNAASPVCVTVLASVDVRPVAVCTFGKEYI